MYLHRCSSSDQHWLVSNCWQYIFYRPSGYHLFTSFIRFPIISLASELGGEVKKTRKGNKQHGLRKNHRPRRRARRHMSGNKIPNASVSLRLCQSASLPSVVYCLGTLLPFRLCTMYTNTHKADYRLEVKNRDR